MFVLVHEGWEGSHFPHCPLFVSLHSRPWHSCCHKKGNTGQRTRKQKQIQWNPAQLVQRTTVYYEEWRITSKNSNYRIKSSFRSNYESIFSVLSTLFCCYLCFHHSDSPPQSYYFRSSSVANVACIHMAAFSQSTFHLPPPTINSILTLSPSLIGNFESRGDCVLHCTQWNLAIPNR